MQKRSSEKLKGKEVKDVHSVPSGFFWKERAEEIKTFPSMFSFPDKKEIVGI